ncbi:MAG TPA: N-formylglutamate amidohydrolase [Flavobacteriales bacterium]|nr:N-formylglutamate amidohydrolase [Flavobacteriales bacterium]HMR25886.1 N-formylglutamate amidohydrolase [Flavobacteriales bacterium]
MTRLLLTCEHGGHEVPTEVRALFTGAEDVLRSHRGWDPGALHLFEALRPLAHLALAGTTSRLVVELNRSLDSPALFSVFTRDLPHAQRSHLIDEHYTPLRTTAADAVATWRAQQRTVLHLSVHSFTPVLDGETRAMDIGLLYDPSRSWERVLAATWEQLLHAAAPDLRIRHNEPYLGTDDGHTTTLRTAHPSGYAGIELEVNQRFATDDGRSLDARVTAAIVASFTALLAHPAATA